MADVQAVDPTANPDGEQKYDEDGNPIEDRPENISEEVMEDMKNLWQVFSDSDGKAGIEELQTLMRALDVKIESDEQLEGIREMIDPENTGYITFDFLKTVMNEQLKEKHTVEDMENALKKLDKNNDGEIPTPEFKQYMTNLGLKMTPEELDEMIKIADPKGEGVISIRDFAESICPPKK